MSTRVIINGAQGKMGALAVTTIENHPDFELVGALTRNDCLQSSITTTKAQIVIDLTRADCAFENALTIINSGAHPVIGTSGLLNEHITKLQQLCQQKQLGGIIAPNFSISAVLMMRFAAQAARYLQDVEIIEAHHPQKFDAPSGTSIKTAEMIAANRLQPVVAYQKENALMDGARGEWHHGVAIHSLRLPGVIARQQVIFGSHGETLSITHDSIDRASFMPGIVLCCQKVLSLHSLYYGLEHLLD